MSEWNEKAIADYFGSISPGMLGLASPPEVKSVSRLELGEANLNFLVTTTTGKFVFRISMDPSSDEKPAEYRILGALHPLGLAPKAFYLDDSRKHFAIF